MFALADRWQYYIDASWAFAQIETGPRAEDTCTMVQYARTLGDVSVSQALVAAEKDGEACMELLRWLAANRLDALTPEARKELLAVIGRIDPPSAAALYCWHAHLTDDEDELLKAAFMPSMGLMRQKIESGTCTRAKGRG